MLMWKNNLEGNALGFFWMIEHWSEGARIKHDRGSASTRFAGLERSICPGYREKSWPLALMKQYFAN